MHNIFSSCAPGLTCWFYVVMVVSYVVSAGSLLLSSPFLFSRGLAWDQEDQLSFLLCKVGSSGDSSGEPGVCDSDCQPDAVKRLPGRVAYACASSS